MSVLGVKKTKWGKLRPLFGHIYVFGLVGMSVMAPAIFFSCQPDITVPDLLAKSIYSLPPMEPPVGKQSLLKN